MQVVISNRAYAGMLAETTEKIKTETGGLFLGKYDMKTETWYIIEVIDPGPKSVFEVAYFEYDREYTEHLIRKIANYYAEKLELVGLWHRHPGSFDVFSSTDDGTNTKYAAIRSEGAISALVNIDPYFRITMYHVGQPCRYSKIKYTIGDENIPQELLQFKSKEQFDTLMQSLLLPNKDKGNRFHKSASFGGFMRSISTYFDEAAFTEICPEPEMESTEVCERILDVMMEDLTFFTDEVNMEVSLSQRDKSIVMVQEAIDETTRVYFSFSESKDVVVFEYKGKNYYYSSGLFKKLFARYVAERREDEKAGQADRAPAEIKQGNITNIIRMLFGGDKQ